MWKHLWLTDRSLNSETLCFALLCLVVHGFLSLLCFALSFITLAAAFSKGELPYLTTLAPTFSKGEGELPYLTTLAPAFSKGELP